MTSGNSADGPGCHPFLSIEMFHETLTGLISIKFGESSAQ